MGIVKKFKHLIKRLILMMMLVLGSVFTPIFGEVGGFALGVFERLTLNTAHTPSAIVVLGGGLTKKNGNIALNHYSQSRADAAIALARTEPSLPIITSGAESPWLAEYIKNALPHAIIISDNASMNTCENARFTAKLARHHELGNGVILITDRYHMARARRQFAKAGIDTLPQIAPIAITPSWTKPKNNWVHSRRAIYEMVALVRDVVRPQSDCRRADDVSIEIIETPRKKPKVFDTDDVDYG